MKKRREGKSLGAKTPRGLLGDGQKKKKAEKLPKKPKAIKIEKAKPRVKKIKDDVVSLARLLLLFWSEYLSSSPLGVYSN